MSLSDRVKVEMDTEERRRYIVEILIKGKTPVTGTELSERLGVSRQVIVQDVAVLRAAGQEILASPQGYYFHHYYPGMHRSVVAVQHKPEETEDELTALVDVGVEVVDVIVEHAIYGEQRGMLHIACREDVRQFMAQLEATGARLLSELTNGVHLHTLEARQPEPLQRAKAVLQERGYLIE